MSEWKTQRLDEIGTLKSGATPDTTIDKYWSGKIAWITPSDLSKLKSRFIHQSERAISKKGLESCSATLMPGRKSIVISSRAPIGYIAIPTADFTTNQGCKSIVLWDDQDPDFHYYNLSHNVNKIKGRGEGTTFAEISKAELEKLQFNVPLLPTQRKIARILSTIDGQIEKTEAIIAKYQAVKQGMLQDLFTRGIDVRTGQLRPRYEDAPELYQESALGMIPKEWEVIELDEGIKILDCKHVTPTYIPNGIPLLRPRNVKTEGLVLNDLVYVSETDYQFLMEKHKLKNEDILFTRNASFGVSCFLRNDIRYAIGQDVVILTDKTDEVTKFYIFQLLNSQVILKQIQRESGGSTFGRINLNDFRRFTIPKPTVDEQNKIRQTIEATDNMLINNRIALSKLQVLKQGLMQDLLSGKVEVTA